MFVFNNLSYSILHPYHSSWRPFFSLLYQAVLMRCGQPLCGSSQKRCREDISLLNSCLQSIGKGRILDVRTQQKAQHQISKGINDTN